MVVKPLIFRAETRSACGGGVVDHYSVGLLVYYLLFYLMFDISKSCRRAEPQVLRGVLDENLSTLEQFCNFYMSLFPGQAYSV